jgi:hypothetical protein
MEPEDIKGQQELWDWLAARRDGDGRADAACVGLRAALRVLPISVAVEGWENAKKSGFTSLPILRALLSSGVAFAHPSPEFAEIARASGEIAQDAGGNAYDVDRRLSDVANAAFGAAEAAAGLIAEDREDDTSFANGAYAAQAAKDSVGALGDGDREVWAAALEDARSLAEGADTFRFRLWPRQESEVLANYRRDMDRTWGADRAIWSFWLRWWEGVLSGNQLDWDLQKEVALIPDAIWQQGPVAVAAAIRQIERHLADLAEPDLIEKDLAALPASPRWQIAHFKDTVALHRVDIPPTLDALLEYCGREIDRLQGRNAPYSSVEEEEEAQRQIRVLTSIFSTLRKLRETIPSDGALNDKDAERGERLTRLFVRLIRQWPSKNAEDLVDSVYRAALVGLTATLGPMIGVPAAVATGAGVALFGGKKIADGIKAAKDLGDMASKP